MNLLKWASWFRGAPPHDKVEQQVQNDLPTLFDEMLRGLPAVCPDAGAFVDAKNDEGFMGRHEQDNATKRKHEQNDNEAAKEEGYP